jgi:hypothetical protein
MKRRSSSVLDPKFASELAANDVANFKSTTLASRRRSFAVNAKF